MNQTQQALMGNTREVAEYLGVEPKTLENWRSLKVGPKWIKVGRLVKYRWKDVERYLDQRVQGGDAA